MVTVTCQRVTCFQPCLVTEVSQFHDPRKTPLSGLIMSLTHVSLLTAASCLTHRKSKILSFAPRLPSTSLVLLSTQGPAIRLCWLGSVSLTGKMWVVLPLSYALHNLCHEALVMRSTCPSLNSFQPPQNLTVLYTH